MIKKIEGEKYLFEIESSSIKGKFAFEIEAIDKRSGRYSTINTLNAFLSWCEIGVHDSRIGEPEWIVSKKEYGRLERCIARLFADKNFIAYLEHKLDEDRIEGEWANIR